ncbi:hypothetical protein [Acetobacter indonesiensis]
MIRFKNIFLLYLLYNGSVVVRAEKSDPLIIPPTCQGRSASNLLCHPISPKALSFSSEQATFLNRVSQNEDITVKGKRKGIDPEKSENIYANGMDIKIPVLGKIHMQFGKDDETHDPSTGAYVAPYGEAFTLDRLTCSAHTCQ